MVPSGSFCAAEATGTEMPFSSSTLQSPPSSCWQGWGLAFPSALAYGNELPSIFEDILKKEDVYSEKAVLSETVFIA